MLLVSIAPGCGANKSAIGATVAGVSALRDTTSSTGGEGAGPIRTNWLHTQPLPPSRTYDTISTKRKRPAVQQYPGRWSDRRAGLVT